MAPVPHIVIPSAEERDAENRTPTHVLRQTSKGPNAPGQFLHIGGIKAKSKYRQNRDPLRFYDSKSAVLWAAMRCRELHRQGVDAHVNMTHEVSNLYGRYDMRFWEPLTSDRSEAEMLKW